MVEQSGADILIEALGDLGVEVIFGYPGGAVLPIYDALYRHNAKGGQIRHILVRHEQAVAWETGDEPDQPALRLVGLALPGQDRDGVPEGDEVLRGGERKIRFEEQVGRDRAGGEIGPGVADAGAGLQRPDLDPDRSIGAMARGLRCG